MYKVFIEKNISTHDLLKKILKKYNIDCDLTYNEYGKPYLKNNQIYFSLSDCDNYSVCAISDKEIGVDIQKLTYKERVIKKICTDEERKLIKNEEDFTKIWVKKESYVKYLGIGLSYGLNKVDTLKINNIKVIRHGNYYIGVCFK